MSSPTFVFSDRCQITLICAVSLLVVASVKADEIFGDPQFYGGTHDFAVVSGDFDNDGTIDILSASPPVRDSFGNLISHGSYAIYRNESGNGIFNATVLDKTHGGSALAAADLNADGNLDVVSCNIIEGAGNSTNVLLGNGDGTFTTAVSYGDTSSYARALALGDMDNDGDIDIVLPNGGRVLLNYGDGTFYTNFVGSDVEDGGTIALGDINEDGHLDVVTARDFYNPSIDYVSVQLGTGNGNGDPGEPMEVSVGGFSPRRVRLIDLNADTHLDLVTINQASNDMSVLYGQGDGTFSSPTIVTVHDADNFVSNVITIADFNFDGLPDVAVTSTVYGPGTSDEETSILLFNATTDTFSLEQVIAGFGQLAENITADDFDGDGDLDLATATHLLWNLLPSTSCEGDANGDGLVDPLDSGYVLARFGCPVGTGDPSCDIADMNGDGLVDPLDVGFILARFGQCP